MGRRYVSGVDSVHLTGDGNASVFFYINMIGTDGKLRRKVCDEIIIPVDQIQDGIMKACTALAMRLVGSTWKPFDPLH